MSFVVPNFPLRREAIASLAMFRQAHSSDRSFAAQFRRTCGRRLKRLGDRAAAQRDLAKGPQIQTYYERGFDPSSWPREPASTWHALQLAIYAAGGCVLVPDNTVSLIADWRRFTDVASGLGIEGLPNVAWVRGYRLFRQTTEVEPPSGMSINSIALVVSLPGAEPMPALIPVVNDDDVDWVQRWAERRYHVCTLWVAAAEEQLLPAGIRLWDPDSLASNGCDGSSIKFRKPISQELDRRLPAWCLKPLFDLAVGESQARGRVA